MRTGLRHIGLKAARIKIVSPKRRGQCTPGGRPFAKGRGQLHSIWLNDLIGREKE
jgi:hypothetical protein